MTLLCTLALLLRLGPMALEELVDSSELVVVAEVERLGVGVAEALVIETWKGDPGETVRFRIDPTWICDTSSAELGERAVWFLSRRWPFGGLRISHSGLGRMPVDTHEGLETCTLWANNVVLPQAMATFPGPEEGIPFIRRVELARLREAVLAQAARSGSPGPQAADGWVALLAVGVLGVLAVGFYRYGTTEMETLPEP